MNKILKIIITISIGFILLISSGNSNEEKIKIGLLVPMTGNDKHLGQLIIKSTRMALENIGDEKIEIFPKDTNSVSQLPLHIINDNSSVQNTNLCLIDINNKNKKCPEGWTHTATTVRGYNVCCKNT